MSYITINKPIEHFNSVLYTGNGSTDRAVTVGFQPDWIWCKERSQTESHMLHNVGMNAGDYIRANTTDGLSNSGEMFKSITSTGFTVGTRGEVNQSSQTYVNWSWKGGGTPTTNTDGTTQSTVSANTTAGFSVVKWTGTGSQTTIGHGLGAIPDLMICRNLSSSEDWSVYHSVNGAGKYLALNTTEAVSTNNNRFNVAPTNQVFTVNTHHSVNKSGDSHIGYLFTKKLGYSKFGSYTGNGHVNGSFVYTGFRPAFVIVKRTDSAGNSWRMFDKVRDGQNGDNANLHANLSNAEDSGSDGFIDMYSNGFRPRTTSTDQNTDSGTYVYMAWADAPLVGTNNVPCNPR